jgi:hypothetical protein
VAVTTARLNSEHIGVMHALRVLLIGGAHFVAGRAELIGFSIFETADKAAGKSNADYERYEPAGRNAEKEPALGAPPEPCCKALVRWRWLRPCHVDPALAMR